MQYGEHEEYFETIMEATGKCPAPLLSRPSRLEPEQQDLYDLYALLSSSRPLGPGGASGISTADILAAADAYGYQADYLMRVIRALDALYLRHLHDQIEKDRKKKK